MKANAVKHATGINVTIDGAELDLSWTWLRDHARDAESFLDSAKQRLVSPTTVAAAGEADVRIDDDELTVAWPGGPTASFPLSELRSIGDASAATSVQPPPSAWTGPELADRIEPLDHAALSTRDGLGVALSTLWRDGVITLRDVPISKTATRSVLERFGYIRSTIFGDLWEFSSDGGYDDTASTPLEITPHTDGTYSNDAPGLLGLHCHTYEATGGENVFVDAHAIAARLPPEHLDVLSTVDIPGQYIGDGAHLMARRPVLRHENGRLVQVSYNHHDRAPFLLPEPLMSRVFSALHAFDAHANTAELQFELAMRPGDMVIFDNWRVLHGRRAFRGDRLIAGGYINREDVESTTRLLSRTS